MLVLSETLQHAMHLAQHQARQYGQGTYGGGHLLYGLLDEDTELNEVFHQLGKEVPRLRRWAEFRIEHYPKASKIIEEPKEDEGIQFLLKEADRIRLKDNATTILPIHALEALCTPEIVFTAEQLRRFPISIDELAALRNGKNGKDSLPATDKKLSSVSDQSNSRPAEDKILARFCDNITEDAQQNKLDPVIGRERELQDIIKILGKRISPNVILVGEPGVGKTAIVSGLAQAIISKQVPGGLLGATIYELDVHGRLVAGAYKGEVEERLKKVLQAIKQYKKVILFIDEIHSLLDDRTSVGAGAINLLKPETAQGDITIIGATTHVEYKRYFEKDPAFARRFTKLEIEEPKEDLAIRMVQGLAPRFEIHHQLAIKSEAIPEAVFLARRYFTTKRLPASAIELLDLTLSSVRIMNDTSSQQLEIFISRLEEIEKKEDRVGMLELFRQIQSSLSHLLFQRLKEVPEINFDNSSEIICRQLRELLLELRSLSANICEAIGHEEVIATAAHQAKIPLGKIQTKESTKLKEIASHLRKRVVGQDYALEKVAAVLKRARTYDSGTGKPLGAFFFAGPTGTGKTELAKAIAEFLFNDENALVRFDMSEYMEKHAAETLLGAPAGYVGYEEGGRLVNSIRQSPYAVLLFDEIEKAHSDIYKLFLQILGGAHLTDRLGKKGDFSNAIIIFTSNVCNDWIRERFETNNPPVSHKDQEILRDKMKDLRDVHGQEVFLPEFIGRIPNIIPFAPISQEVAYIILSIQINKFRKVLSRQHITLEVNESAKKALVEQGFSPNYGARPLEYIIEEMLGTPVAEMIIAGELEEGSTVQVEWQDEQGFIWKNVTYENSLT